MTLVPQITDHLLISLLHTAKARGQEGLRTGLCDNLVVTRCQSIYKAVRGCITDVFHYINEVYFWGKCSMPLMNIQSDWMSMLPMTCVLYYVFVLL